MIKANKDKVEFHGMSDDLIVEMFLLNRNFRRVLAREGCNEDEIKRIHDTVHIASTIEDDDKAVEVGKEAQQIFSDMLERTCKDDSNKSIEINKPGITVITCTPDNLDEAVGIITDAIMESMVRTVGEKEDGSSN